MGINFGPPCGGDVGCRYPLPSCYCDQAVPLVEELAFPVGGEIECADNDCALRDGHTVPHMDDLALAWYDGARCATQTVLPL